MHPGRREWIPHDLDTLERLLGRVSTATVAKKLKRTEASVVMKIKALGNSRRVCEGYTMRDLEVCLGDIHLESRPGRRYISEILEINI